MKPANYKTVSPFDTFFNRALTDFVGSDYHLTQPAVNVVAKEDAYIIEVAAPGLEKEHFHVKVEDNTLYLSAKKEEKTEEKEAGKYLRRSFNYSSFTRNFQLPEDVNADAIAASYENGVLTLTLPKVEKVELSRQIEIQ